MQQTLNLLEKALTIAPMPVWTEKLKLHRNALRNAKNSGHLTPVQAGALAIELEEDPAKWITLAVIEGEKQSPAKDRLERSLKAMRKLYFSTAHRLRVRYGASGLATR